MSLFRDFITIIASSFFTSSEETLSKKITPKMELDDVELGNVSRKVMAIHNSEKYIDCEFKSIIQNPDLELGFGPIVEINCGDVTVDMKAFEKCKIYENYMSFMESISYLATPFKDRTSVFFKDLYPSWKSQLIKNDFHVVMHIESASIGLRLNTAAV